MPISFLGWAMLATVFSEQSDLVLTAWAVFAGIISGLVAALPTVLLLRCVSQRHAPHVAVGLICSLLGVLTLQGAIFIIHWLKPAVTRTYGVAATLTLLTTIIVTAFLTWRKMDKN